MKEEDNYVTIGSRIKKFRQRKKLTQTELSKRANISRSYLADVERDRYHPSIATLQSIANVIDVDTSTIISMMGMEKEECWKERALKAENELKHLKQSIMKLIKG